MDNEANKGQMWAVDKQKEHKHRGGQSTDKRSNFTGD